ncbi:MAG: type II toxin-antitoxin system RelE/ParE family toxin [Candidatus Sungbacteria bacterium]|uniref:Type II toxin-antitoxin system RelE/ParE family toxin n=1 Tax=Candidatus Sungiibacteriota bacterium TaxID=2750080 RepID=A0A932DSL6_9BACT|nr:type II toxin-antitoxin system RelE/ParE family toxin [Candidatus Sungbacteria bacterium]MBI2466155.1 type II toxin-antitoxin system RelE/ParE family toxin [Candidatus Sungbacteria bacterium]
MLKLNPVDAALKSKKLKVGINLWRVRVGTHRLVYSFDRDSLTLLRIRHRKDVYKGLTF